jgi:hypothetical protein
MFTLLALRNEGSFEGPCPLLAERSIALSVQTH